MTGYKYWETSPALAHHGVKGMHWHVRKSHTAAKGPSQRTIKKENKAFVKKSNEGVAAARKTVSRKEFRTEVKAAQKGQGVSRALQGPVKSELSSHGYMTSKIVSDNFRNTKNEKVSVDFANAIMNQAVKNQDRKRLAITGAAFIAAGLVTSR